MAILLNEATKDQDSSGLFLRLQATAPGNVRTCYLSPMPDGRDKNARKHGGRDARRAAAGQGQTKGSRFQKFAQMVGNEEIRQRIGQGNTNRDAMLDHLCGRLQVMRELQTRELALTERGAQWSWWRTAADNMKKNSQEPEPTRWNEAARQYEAAAKALCKGDLMRGRQLLADAMSLEERAQESLTDLVDQTNLEQDTAPDTSVLGDASPAAAGTPRELPKGVEVAQEIYSVTQTVPNMPNRKRIRDPWWTEAEEEEEEDADGGGA